ncbi:unnamed protein product [Oppiella nova]|uniref:Phospholipase B-like n=1 Tax=Oppiella nova TaxID=334625 RepID=A0A7R9LEK5_9ACAR|nr:unnamed protein product [Oppiella nova]CAG2162352.1 unnamed protein product [Oppiella nova]
MDLPKETVALLIYENNVNKTGWANLELRTYEGFSDEIQSYMAGVIEGYITGELIHMNYRNRIEGYCDERKRFCELLKEFTENNTKFVETMIEKNKNNDYWHQIGLKAIVMKGKDFNKNNDYWHQLDLIYKQINGLEEGYKINGLEEGYKVWKVENNIKNPTERQYLSEIFWLNVGSELSNLRSILTPNSTVRYRGHCSAIVKPLADGSDLFVAHNTWSGFETMLRIMKKYSFAFNTLQSNHTKRIAGHSVSFSSSPGRIFSGDDYYVLSSGLVVQETTISNRNLSLYKDIKAEEIVFEFIRNVVSNRLAESGKEWTQLFGPYNSGTYNNQFMIVDYKLFKKGTKVSKLADNLLWIVEQNNCLFMIVDYKLFKKGTKVSELADNLLWIVEQLPDFIHSADVTPVLRSQGYWASYNVPYFQDIYQISGNEDLFRKSGPYYSYNLTARALIFKREESKVTDLKTLYSLMRYNDFKKDPLSECKVYNKECIPPYSADLTIAARNDLNEVNGSYPIDSWKREAEGATDAKMTNSSMVKDLEMLAVSGPTDAQQPPFQWSTSGFKDNHYGHPDLFNFKPIYVKWFPKSYETADDECIPPYSADLTIAARNDLNEVNGSYPIDSWKREAEGATDAKMTNSSMVKDLEILAVSGPTDAQQPPFRWSTSGFKDNHYGHPDLFNFKPIYVKWFPKSILCLI